MSWLRAKRPTPEDEIRMMKSPGEWPMYPMLPIKKRKADHSRPDLGVLMEGHGPRVYKTSIDEMLAVAVKPEAIQYDSIEAIVADGWVVD